MSFPKELRPTLPILLGAAIMLSLSGGIRQSFGLIMPPLTRAIAVTVSDFALAMSVQTLAWGFLQPVAGALVQVLPRWHVVDEGAIYIVTPSATGSASKTKAFSDWVCNRLSVPPWV